MLKYILKCVKLGNSLHVFISIMILYILKCTQTSESKVSILSFMFSGSAVLGLGNYKLQQPFTPSDPIDHMTQVRDFFCTADLHLTALHLNLASLFFPCTDCRASESCPLACERCLALLQAECCHL